MHVFKLVIIIFKMFYIFTCPAEVATPKAKSSGKFDLETSSSSETALVYNFNPPGVKFAPRQLKSGTVARA